MHRFVCVSPFKFSLFVMLTQKKGKKSSLLIKHTAISFILKLKAGKDKKKEKKKT